MKRALAALSLLVVVSTACASAHQAESENIGTTSEAVLADVASFGANPAELTMHKYVPQGMPTTPRPLVVVLHGCTQTAAAYEAAGWDALADDWKFYVVYPQQNTTKNNSSGCFNWGGRWQSAPQTFVLTPEALDITAIQRGHDENESIKEMVDKMKADHPIDPARVFVTGLSSGGAMVSVMLATWPDVFAGGAIFSGVPYGCATNHKTTDEASACLKDYTGANAYLSRTPQQWGDLVRAASPTYKGPAPKVSIWHGTADYIVNNANQAELVKQWTNVAGISQTPAATGQVDGFPHAEYKDASGKTIVETYQITGQGHGTDIAPSQPIDPAQASGPKCGTAGSYILSTSICSTYYVGKFWGLDGAGSPASGDGGTGGPASTSSSSSSSSSGGANGGSGGAKDDGGTPSYGSTCDVSRGGGSGSVIPLVMLVAATALLRARKRSA
jgi:poly(hydroxyalkanoate) depolymerase family esterase